MHVHLTVPNDSVNEELLRLDQTVLMCSLVCFTFHSTSRYIVTAITLDIWKPGPNCTKLMMSLVNDS